MFGRRSTTEMQQKTCQHKVLAFTFTNFFSAFISKIKIYFCKAFKGKSKSQQASTRDGSNKIGSAFVLCIIL